MNPTGRSAVYCLFDAAQRLLYVGVSNNPAGRLYHHAQKSWWKEVASEDVTWFDTRAEALRVERNVIRAAKPPYNLSSGEWAFERTHAPKTKFDPPPELLAAVAEFEDAKLILAEARAEVEGQFLALMRAGVSGTKIADHIPGWSAETLRQMARSEGIPPMRESTVESIKNPGRRRPVIDRPPKS